jgi:Pumilio-family RNA binding repeat
MPQTGLNMFRPVLNSPPNEQNFDLAMSQPPVSTQKPQRHSMGVTFNGVGETSRYEQPAMTSIGSSASRPTSLLSSFSTNDLPTVKNSTGLASNINVSKANIDQHFHNHNANLGRIPPGAASNRQSRDFPVAPTAAEPKRDDKVPNVQSLLQANATPFGPPMISTTDSNALSTALLPYSANTAPGAYGFGMQTYNLSSNSPTNQVQAVQSGYNGYSVYGGYGRLQDSQTRVVHQRRPQGGGEAARYDNVPIENYRGKLYELCKDQHGCRYLQKRLEEKDPEHTMMIFRETLPFVVELMTGKPAGTSPSMATNFYRPLRQLSLSEIA